MSLFFPENVNLTVWTIGYAVPYHAEQVWEKYKIGYGIISLQAKEAEHAAIKFDLSLTNRSRETDTVSGKWLQVFKVQLCALILSARASVSTCSIHITL